MANEIVVVKGDGISVDLLLWRRYGRAGTSLVEQTLAMNPGIARLGPLLPLGTRVELPPLPERVAVPVRAVSLFG